MKYINWFLDLSLKIWKYSFLFLIIYFWVILFVGWINPDTIISYFQIWKWITWNVAVFKNRIWFKNVAYIPTLIWLIISWVIVAIFLFKERDAKSTLVIILKIISLIVFGVFSWLLLLHFDKSLDQENKVQIRRFIKFRVLLLLIQMSWFLSSAIVDFLLMLQWAWITLWQHWI